MTASAAGHRSGAGLSAVLAAARQCCAADAVITDPVRLATYECDGLTAYRVVPGLVVLTTTTEQVRRIVQACQQNLVPFVARGSGTGLSGGALPAADGVLIVTAPMRSVREISAVDLRAVAEPGVTNLEVTKQAAPHGYFFAPDPSSQQICSVGGNIAENSGGAHCLKYGFTTNHVVQAELVTPSGAVVNLGTRAPDAPGYDLLGVVVGSEGTLGIVTKATLRLVRAPEAVQTVLAGFSTVAAAGQATSAIIAAGIVPAAIEFMDALAIRAAEAAVGCGYPAGAEAVLIVEVDGCADEVEHELAEVIAQCVASGAFETRLAASDVERALIWRGRKSAFAAVGRISPDYIVQDGVVPRTALPQALLTIGELADQAGLRVANVFHAGDGNQHPLVLYDAAVDGAAERAERLAAQILAECVVLGGSITGEHGVGSDKAALLPLMFSQDDLDTMRLIRRAFDPGGIANPGKVFPAPRLCGEGPRPAGGSRPPGGAEVA